MIEIDKPFYPRLSKNSNFSTASLMEARNFYYRYTLQHVANRKFIFQDVDFIPAYENQKDLPIIDIFGKHFFYGMIDKDGDIILPINQESNFKSIFVSSNRKNFRLQNFVADAFLDLRKMLDMEILKGIVTERSFFFNIDPERAYENFDKIFSSTCIIIAQKFKKYAIDNKKINSSIKNINDFNREYLKFLLMHMDISPATKSSLALFYNIKTFHNGITFSISNFNKGNDEQKYVNFFTDPSFVCFVDLCTRFGFRFDINVPYFIQADLNSAAFKKYLEKYGFSNIEEMHEKRYKKVFHEDIDGLKELFYYGYKNYIKDNTQYKEYVNNICSSKARQNKFLFLREDVTLEDFNKKFSVKYWMSMYIYLKNYETNRQLTQKQYEKIIHNSIIVMQSKGLKGALKFINSFFKIDSNMNITDPLQESQSVVTIDSGDSGMIAQNSNLGEDLIFRG